MIAPLDDTPIRALIGYRPKTLRQARVHLTTLLILDTGQRVSEAFLVGNGDNDCDDSLLKVFVSDPGSVQRGPNRSWR